MKKGLLLFLGLAAVIAAGVLVAALRVPFRDTVVSRVPSPDGKFLAVHFTRNVGDSAATPLHHVVIQPSDDKFRVRESETVFIADRLSDLRLHWEGTKALHVDFDEGRAVHEVSESHGIRILFNGAPGKPDPNR